MTEYEIVYKYQILIREFNVKGLDLDLKDNKFKVVSDKAPIFFDTLKEVEAFLTGLTFADL